MVLLALSLVALVLVAIFFGIHLIGLVSLNPALRSMGAGIYIPMKQTIDITAPRIAKPLMLLCLLVATATLVVAAISGSMVATVASAVSLAALSATLLAIIRGDLPLNRIMSGWLAEEPPEEWRSVRSRWEWFFALRTAANGVAMIAMVIVVVDGVIGVY